MQSSIKILKTIRNLGCVLSVLSGSQAFAAHFASYDVAVLWPLRGHFDEDGNPLKIKNTGYCLIPDLALNIKGNATSTPSVKKTQFDKFARLVFKMGQEGVCNPENIEASDPLLLGATPAKHLALRREIKNEACRYANWRIVSLRYDPCVNRDEKKITNTADLESCEAAVRLVAQPFHLETKESFSPIDMTLHLLYTVSDKKAVVADLKKFSAVTKEVIKNEKWDEYDSLPEVLKPHPGLRAETELCTEGSSRKPVVISELLNFLRKHANAEKLNAIAWMTSSMAQQQWTFGKTEIKGDDIKSVSGVKGSNVEFDNFSNELFTDEGKFPFNTHYQSGFKSGPNVMQFFTETHNFTADLTDAKKKKLGLMMRDLDILSNPKQSKLSDSNCVSCHMVDQTRVRLMNLKVQSADNSMRYGNIKIWPPFEIVNRGQTNFRNFGYGPKFDFGVSERLINDTHQAVKLMNAFY